MATKYLPEITLDQETALLYSMTMYNQLSIRVSVTGKAFYGIMLLRSRLDTS